MANQNPQNQNNQKQNKTQQSTFLPEFMDDKIRQIDPEDDMQRDMQSIDQSVSSNSTRRNPEADKQKRSITDSDESPNTNQRPSKQADQDSQTSQPSGAI